MKLKGLVIIGLSALTLAACNSSSNSESSSMTENVTKEMTPEKWVSENKNKNIDDILTSYNLLDDQIKEKVSEQVADSNYSIFDKKVKITGKATEFVEGYNGYSKGSFIVETEAGNLIRISAKKPNEALDLGEQVEITGLLAGSLSNTETLVIRDASVYIK